MQEIIRKLAKENNLSEEVVERVVRSQFMFLKECIERGAFETVRLHYLGVFRAKPAQIRRMKEKGYVGRQK